MLVARDDALIPAGFPARAAARLRTRRDGRLGGFAINSDAAAGGGGRGNRRAGGNPRPASRRVRKSAPAAAAGGGGAGVTEGEPVADATTTAGEAAADVAEDLPEVAAEESRAEDAEGDEDESEAERRRRRRGRRGGRRRGRREGAEAEFEGPRPASDTVEILPVVDFAESEPPLVEAYPTWPVEAGAEAIETASLPALAGEPIGDHSDVAAAVEIEAPTAGPAESAVIEARGTERERVPPPPTAESEQGVAYAGETERELETAWAVPERQHTPPLAHPVETVIEKPANPRRGWWQRLIQP